VLPKNPQLNNILNIARTIEQLNLKLKEKFWMAAQKFMGAQKLLGGVIASPSDGPWSRALFSEHYSSCRKSYIDRASR